MKKFFESIGRFTFSVLLYSYVIKPIAKGIVEGVKTATRKGVNKCYTWAVGYEVDSEESYEDDEEVTEKLDRIGF